MEETKLKILYTSSPFPEDLDKGLKYHKITREQLIEVAEARKWDPSPGTLTWLNVSAGSAVIPDQKRVKTSYILTNRLLHTMLEQSITDIQGLRLQGLPLLKCVGEAAKIHSELMKTDAALHNIKTDDIDDGDEYGFNITVRKK